MKETNEQAIKRIKAETRELEKIPWLRGVTKTAQPRWKLAQGFKVRLFEPKWNP